ncbi:MAG: tRNA threonylcarbamoyladenosine dehydratase [Oscillospiraceae bacterium]|nr:tRNA threonylcarbamoyladenosine dehydratase [Oscillospiraceae bacterium]
MLEEFSRSEMILGSEALERLSRARVAVFGIGGVGGYAVEALARCGVGTIDITDCDSVAVSNINRQIIATHETVGMAKVEAAARRIRLINPNCTVIMHEVFFGEENEGDFDFEKFDYIADAVDTVTAKLALVKAAKRHGVPIISCMGTGNKLDPTAFKVSDIYKTSVCPLARVMRYELRKLGIDGLRVVWSDEKPITPPPVNDEGNRRSIPGSVSFVPPAAGLIMAGEIIKDIAGVRENF